VAAGLADEEVATASSPTALRCKPFATKPLTIKLYKLAGEMMQLGGKRTDSSDVPFFL
jgi:hypothetical protein